MSDKQVAGRIAQALGEQDSPPRHQIKRIVEVCGPRQSLAWLKETQAIEARGGMPTSDGARRRTPGGVYFKLVRDRLTRAGLTRQMYAIFRPQLVTKEAAGPEVSQAAWHNRSRSISKNRNTTGKAFEVKVTLIGKPGKAVERQHFTLLQMKHSGPLPALPKGVPRPEKVPTTTYVVYISAKQWRKVKESLSNPDDVLIVEGTQMYDAEYSAIAVFATNTTTKLLQQAQRQPAEEKNEQASESPPQE